jgi:hypothetical protein
MSDFRIEKIRRRVTVTLSGGRVIEGDVFLQPTLPYRGGPQEPAELFNEPDPFIPLATQGYGTTDEFVLLGKEQIARVQFEATAADTPLEGVEDAAVEVGFADGSSTSGKLLLETRADRPRLLDFLNDDQQRFLTLRSPQGVCLINRRLISQVRHRR